MCCGRVQELHSVGRSLSAADSFHPMVYQELLWSLHATGRRVGNGHWKTCPLISYVRKSCYFFSKTQLPRQPLTRVMQGCLSSQVARRPSYKGAASTKVHLPMDSATVIGLVAIFGSILPAQGLTPSALKTCATCFDALQSVACISQNLVLIPELQRMILPVEKNKVKMSALRSALKTLDLKPDRPVIQTPFLRECITRFQVSNHPGK